jgi:hypothetical protein
MRPPRYTLDEAIDVVDAFVAPTAGVGRAFGTFSHFVETFARVALTIAQRVLCLVAYDGLEPRDLVGEERDVARMLFGDVDVIPASARHVLVVVAGARGGKSYVICALRLLYLALTVSLETLAPGERAAALIVAPDLRLARQTLRYAHGVVEQSPEVEAFVSQRTADGILLRRSEGRSVSIECLPATRGGSAVRGRSLVGAVLDECAFFRDESSVVNDAEVYKAVAPRIMGGGQLIVASTPWAEAGLLYELFRANHARPTTALAAHAPTTLLRGDERTLAMVARERERDPDNAAREFDAQFLPSGSGLFFDRGAIDRAIDYAMAWPCAPTKGAVVVAAADFGFRSDSCALVIVHRRAGQLLVAEIVELRPEPGKPLVPSVVVKTFAEVVRRHGAACVIADGHYREAIAEHLATHNLSFAIAPEGATGKLTTYTRTRALLHEGTVVLPNHARLLKQLREVVAVPTPGGGLSFSSPRWRQGGHGDIASAMIIALAELGGMPYEAPPRKLTPAEQAEEFERRALAKLDAEQAEEARERRAFEGDYGFSPFGR